MNQDKFFIGGEWVDPAGYRQLEVISPHTEEVIGQVPDATDRRHRPRRRRRPRGLRRRPVAAHDARPSAPTSSPRISAAHPGRAMDEFADTHLRGDRLAVSRSSIMGQVFAATMVLDYYAGLAREYRVRGAAATACSGPTLVRREPVGVVGGDHAVERAAVHHHRSSSARRWPSGSHRRAEAGARDAARRLPARRGPRARPACPPACSTSCPPAARSASTS